MYKAKYYALKEVINELIYLIGFIDWIKDKISIKENKIPIILIDNEAARKLAENPEFHKRTKHIDIMYHYIREVISSKKINLVYISITYEIADFLTKNLAYDRFSKLKTIANISKKKE